MPSCDLIICERSNRWASAMRSAIERDTATSDGFCCRLREERILGELASELAQRPASLVAIEVRDGNLNDVLIWLAAADGWFPRARCVALVEHTPSAGRLSDGPPDQESPLHDVCSALREAGALEIVQSPRRLEPLLELARRHALAATQHGVTPAESASFTEQVWASLPWQEA